jgi:hypothetical protein
MASDSLPPLVAARSLDRAPDRPFMIVGLTSTGGAFRPSDWTDRLAGVMSSFQPGGVPPESRFQFSPYALPGRYGAQACVRVDPAISEVEPMALSFLFNFARDNDLHIALSFDSA